MDILIEKIGDNRRVLYDQVSIINYRCNYLRKIKSFREAGYDIVYLDETWVNQNHCTDYMWLPNDGSDAPKIPSGKGKRLIVLHAGTRSEGLIDGCDLVFLSKSKYGDYHQEMNSFVFLEWFENQLMPATCLVVLDNASYYNDLISIIAKNYIFKCKLNEQRLNIVEFKHKIMWYRSLEQYISKKNNTILAFEIYFQLIIIFFVCLIHIVMRFFFQLFWLSTKCQEQSNILEKQNGKRVCVKDEWKCLLLLYITISLFCLSKC